MCLVDGGKGQSVRCSLGCSRRAGGDRCRPPRPIDPAWRFQARIYIPSVLTAGSFMWALHAAPLPSTARQAGSWPSLSGVHK